MPRSPKGGKRSRSQSPSQSGSRKASKSLPKTASAAIRSFLGRKMGVLMLLQFLLGTEISFNWIAYQGSPMPLPEGPLTAEGVTTWLVTRMFRFSPPGEEQISDQELHRVVQFLRENAQLDDLKLLFDFIKKFQKDLMIRNIVPNWVLIILAPICGSDGRQLSDLLRNTFNASSEFWQNAVLGLTLDFLQFWLTEHTSYVWYRLLFQILQQPLSEDIKQIVQAFFAGKPFDFFLEIPVDLLILLKDKGFLTEKDICKYLFSAKRRNLIFSRIFLSEKSLENPIVQEFLKKQFPTIHTYISRTHPMNVQNAFSRVFQLPHVFFKHLLETEGLLVQSQVQAKEMAKFLSLFFWNPSLFFPTSIDLREFVSQIMRLPDIWKFLFVQLWRCQQIRFGEYHVGEFVELIRQMEQCFFSKTLASLMRVYMTEVIANSDPEVRKNFFKWLLEQKQSIQAHFPLTPDTIQFCLREFPGVQTKKTLFWWLFTVHAAKIDQRSDRELTINMTEICQEYGLQVTEEELDLRGQNGLNPVGAVCQFFNVITLNFEFGSYKVTRIFVSVCYCDRFETEGSDLFRAFVYRWRNSLGPHINPNQAPNCSALIALINTCEAHPDFFKQSPPNDRSFLIKLFGEYLPKLKLSEELVQLLHRFSKLMPDDVRQAMFASCAAIKIFHEESLGSKQSRDPTDPLSYEAKCSRCARYFPLQGLGQDGYVGAVCRRCSQANETPILTTFNFNFGSL